MKDLDDDRLDNLMREAGASYRTPPEPPIEAMWRAIDGRAFAPRRQRWWMAPLALAATLILGLGVGFWAGRADRTEAPTSATTLPEATLQLTSTRATPFVGVATNYVQQMTALLIAVVSELKTGRVPVTTITQARELLSTTRLLLDSGIEDPKLRDLLEDLELVLAQVVRLRDNDESHDAALINQALNEREVLPRLTYYLADNSVAP
jgi:hypothetical protein